MAINGTWNATSAESVGCYGKQIRAIGRRFLSSERHGARSGCSSVIVRDRYSRSYLQRRMPRTFSAFRWPNGNRNSEDFMTRYLLSFALIWLLSFSPLSAEPAKVMIIRHGEKPDEGHCLSLKGWQRAAALVPFFLGATADECDPLPGFGTPVAIYAQKPTQGNKSLRPMQTVQGLARALQLDMKPFWA
jgi:hypothetical protein